VTPQLPTRVVDVLATDNSSFLQLFISKGACAKYAALSYCWGALQPASLTRVKLDPYTRAISLTTLPKTIQDAISVTQKLGLRYLWVDSLCIIQDSEEDTAREIGQMSRIFQQASITIVAASASNCNQGFLKYRSPPSECPNRVSKGMRDVYSEFTMSFLCPDGSNGTILLHQSSFNYLKDPLYDRAWALQETVLSPRTLIYSSLQQFWKCRTTFNRDGGYTWWNQYSQCGGIKLSQLNLGKPNASRDPFFYKSIQDDWVEAISSFSCKSLSYYEDKLPAFSGLVTEFQKITGDEYLAGLRRSRLVEDLTWRRATSSRSIRPRNATRQPMSRPQEWRCPSWSWMSIDGPVAFGSLGTPISQIIECVTLPLSKLAPFGQITDGFLIIDGPLSQVAVELEPSPASYAHAREGAETDRLLSVPSDGSAPTLIGRVLLDVQADMGQLMAMQLWTISLISVHDISMVEPYPEFHGLVLKMTVGYFQRIGYFFSLREGSNWFSGCSNTSITIR
jgi:hypothetical protein